MRGLGPIVLLDTLTGDQLNQAPAYFNARYLLSTAADSPIPATRTLGGLTQSFVERAVAEMRWPSSSGEVVRFVGRGLEERDVPRLRRLRIALQVAGLLRTYRGAFHATARGRSLLRAGREGRLYLSLFDAYLAGRGPNPVDGLPTESWVEEALPAFLWLLLVSAGSEISIGDVATTLSAEPEQPADTDGVWEASFEVVSTTLRQALLEPMEDLGLVRLETARRGKDRASGLDASLTITHVTPLFERFVIATSRLN